jgi:4-hydroxythreonine-4-phosphate dehydrogenase
VKEKKIDAMVTGPVSKELIEKSGTRFSGHTEYIADKINEPEPYMMMFSDQFRVLLVSTHIPISEVAGYVTYEKIFKTI